MATSSEIQFLGQGATALGGSNTVIESFKFSGTVVIGDLVCFDPAGTTLVDDVKTVKAVDHTSALQRQLAIGVAIDSSAAAVANDEDSIRVVVAGGPVLVKSINTVVAGDQLVASGAVAGSVVGAVQADTVDFPTLVGVALEAHGATLAGHTSVFVKGLYSR